MKKLILGIFMIVLFVGATFAQGGQKRERIKAQKAAYITNRIELTTKEAEVFWPIYNQFEKDKNAINKKYKRKKRVVDMSDEELEKQMLAIFEKDQEQLDLKKMYFKNLKEVLSIRKIAMLQVAEREFKTNILKSLREKKKERRRQRRNQEN